MMACCEGATIYAQTLRKQGSISQLSRKMPAGGQQSGKKAPSAMVGH